MFVSSVRRRFSVWNGGAESELCSPSALILGELFYQPMNTVLV